MSGIGQVIMNRLGDYIYIFLTIAFTVYGQMVLKWRIAGYGALPAEFGAKLKFLLLLLLDPLILSGFVGAFLASLAWMAAMTKFDITHAYPFMSLNFVLVLLLGALLLQETVTAPKAIGVLLIVLGTLVISKG